MKGVAFLASGVLVLGLVGCGAFKKEEAPEQLDPYRSPMADQINAVLYTRKSPEKIMAKLGELGVGPGRLFGEFSMSTKIDDWFADAWKPGFKRYTSLTCGLSPVVDEGGRMKGFYRNKKFIDGKIFPELLLTPELEAAE